MTLKLPAQIHTINPADVPNPSWLVPATPGSNQQQYGNGLLEKHVFLMVPSAESRHSLNLIFDAGRVSGLYDEVTQERFTLDPRLQAS